MRILSLNAFWFQGVPFEGTDPPAPRPHVVSRVAAALRPLTPDVLCLQEIQSSDALRPVKAEFPELAHQAYSTGAVFPQYGVAVLSRRPTALISSTERLVPPPQRAFQVSWVNALTIAHIHLPSGRQEGVEQAARLRVAELRRILEAAPGIDVWAGDVNEPPGGGVDGFWAENGFVDAAEFTGQDHHPTAASGQNRGDRIAVRRALTERLIAYGVMPVRMFLGPEGRPLSDHLPLWIDLSV